MQLVQIGAGPDRQSGAGKTAVSCPGSILATTRGSLDMCCKRAKVVSDLAEYNGALSQFHRENHPSPTQESVRVVMGNEKERMEQALRDIDSRLRSAGQNALADCFLHAMLNEMMAALLGSRVELDRARKATGAILFEIGEIAPGELKAYLMATSNYDIEPPRPIIH